MIDVRRKVIQKARESHPFTKTVQLSRKGRKVADHLAEVEEVLEKDS